ncbi:MAG: Queuine tRNA-ribosyltransferase, partial [uncultured Rubrobacteraceae bacterium]
DRQGRRGAGRASSDRAWARRDAPLYARRHQGHRQGSDAGGPARGRGRRRARQHLPPLPASRRGPRGGGRGAARLQRLGRADAHGLGRLPGLLAGEDAPDRGEGRPVRLRLRRVEPRVHAGAHDEGPGASRRGHRHGARRV